MGSFEDIKEILWGEGKKTIKIARLNSLISQEESKIGSIYYQIGEMYVRIHGNDGEERFANMVEAITDSKYKIEDYKRQIRYLKSSQNYGYMDTDERSRVPQNYCNDDFVQCPKCKLPVEKGTRYCTRCGELIEQLEKTNSNGTERDEDFQRKICPVCGRQVKSGAVYCTRCGTEL